MPVLLSLIHIWRAEIDMKGKHRVILLPNELKNKLKDYMDQQNIRTGSVFITRNGKPVDRSNIFHEMKRLSAYAGVKMCIRDRRWTDNLSTVLCIFY